MLKLIFDSIYPSCSNQEEQMSILKSIIELTEGKIYVEFEYSRAVRYLTEILLSQGKIEEATKLVQDIQIETFGSLDRLYKTEYVLFQMKTLITKGDFIRTLIVSNKIIRSNLDEEGIENYKIGFYLLMIRYYIHEENYFETCICYQILYNFYMKLVSNPNKIDPNNKELFTTFSTLSAKDLFEKYIYFLNISPPNNETKSKILETKTTYIKELEEYSTLGKLISLKTGDEIVQVSEDYLSQYDNSIFYDNSEFFVNGKANAKLFRKYVIQHNITVFHRFYIQINLKRISEIIQVNTDEVEAEICDMVMNKFIYAKINRIKGTASFRLKQTFDRRSDTINNDLNKMLETLETTCHLIHKETLKYGLAKAD